VRVLGAFFSDHDDRSDLLRPPGGFHRLIVPKVPYYHPRMFFVAEVESDPGDRESADFTMTLSDYDGQTIYGPIVSSHISAGRLVVPFQDVEFPAEGIYTFNLFYDGKPVASAPIRLKVST
jgi:hypothetical protein